MCPFVISVKDIDALVSGAEPRDLPNLASALAGALSTVLVRSAALTLHAAPPSRPEAIELLTIDEASRRLGLPKCWLYRHAKTLPFTRKLGHRTLRFDARGLERWASARRNTL
jgi:excisionase family DNA binding protein